MPEALTSLEASIRGSLTQETFWVAASAIFSAAVALATFLLAKSTKQLATETIRTIDEARLSRELADRHHQEALLPFVVMRGALSRTVTVQYGERRTDYVLLGEIYNVGPGPAYAVSMYIEAFGEVPRFEVMSPMGGNSTHTLEIRWSLPNVETGSLSVLIAHPFTVKISYSSAFETMGMTVQHSSTGLLHDLRQLETTTPAKAVNRT